MMIGNRSASGAPRSWRRSLRTGTALVLAGSTALSGCYSYVPVIAAPPAGSALILDLNDRGRVALGDSIGPSVASVEGLVQSATDSQYVLRVSAVRYLNGQENHWSGEPLSLGASLVSRARERRFSRIRTWAVGLGAVAVVAAVLLGTDIIVNHQDPDRPVEPRDPTPEH